MSGTCRICGKPCDGAESCHPRCSRRMFASDLPPEIPFGTDELKGLAQLLINTNTTVTGVQKKLSLTLEREGENGKLTFVSLWGDFILKPSVDRYPQLPENEFLTMCLAEEAGIETVPHALLEMASGENAYVTRRIDRDRDLKIHMEDMAQLTGRLTEDKYKGSVVQIAKIVKKHCRDRMLDVLRLFELVVFSYISGNGDMHLKNYSLIHLSGGCRFSPAYDLLNTRLVLSQAEDPEESALTINGKKNRIGVKDLSDTGIHFGLTEKQISNVYRRFLRKEDDFLRMIDGSFLSDEKKKEYADLLKSRLSQFRTV